MKKIKIFYIIDRLVKGAGTERQLVELISHIDKKEFECTLVTLKPLDGNVINLLSEIKCAHICLHIDKLISPQGIRQVFRLAGLIRKGKIDIVQTHFVDANFVGILAAWMGGCRAGIFSRRDMGYWYTSRLLFWLRQINRLAGYCLVNAEAVKNVVAEKEKFDRDHIVIIRNGIFEHPNNTITAVDKSEVGIPQEAPVVGIVANLRPVKRLDNFIHICAGLKNTQSFFIIFGIGDQRDDLLNLAHETGLDSRLIITHTTENIYRYISMFDIGVLTSDSEGLSNTLIEYQLCGKPAVAFNVGGNCEVIINGQTGFLVDKGDLNMMGRRIDQLLTDEELRSEMGHKAALNAKKKFGGARMVRETSDFYRKILGI